MPYEKRTQVFEQAHEWILFGRSACIIGVNSRDGMLAPPEVAIEVDRRSNDASTFFRSTRLIITQKNYRFVLKVIQPSLRLQMGLFCSSPESTKDQVNELPI